MLSRPLNDLEITTIVATMDHFGLDLLETVFDFGRHKSVIYQWIAKNLEHSMLRKEERDDRNIFVAFGNIYVNTNSVSQFVDYLASNPLEPWDGGFNSPQFVLAIQEWSYKDLKKEG